MISTNTAVAAISVAQEFDSRGLLLTATPGTPLAQLVNCNSLLMSDVSSTPEYSPNADSISANSLHWGRVSDDTESAHTLSLNKLSAEISTYVKSHLNFAKNTVRPLIEELVTEIKTDIEALPVNSEFSMDIVISDLPEPMTLSAFEDAIMEYKDVEFFAITSYMNLPSLSAPEIMEKLLTGQATTDKAVSTWAAKKGDSFFQSIWDCVFTNLPTSQKFENLVNDNESGVDAAIAVYLLANKLFDNPIEGASVSLSAFNRMIAELRQQSALRIVHAYGEYVRFTTTGLLIKGNSPGKVTVVGDVYRKWIEAGGNNAVIFGSVLSGKSEKFVSDIDGKKSEYMATWERQNWMLTVAERNKRFVYYKEILRNRTLKLVADNFTQCYGHLNENGTTDSNMPEYVQFKVCLDEYLTKVQESWFSNLWKLSQDVICTCIFYYTDAGKILSGIEKACCDNEGIDVREAALLSTIAYVTDYVCDQMKVSSL